jgi:hypothetical protein
MGWGGGVWAVKSPLSSHLPPSAVSCLLPAACRASKLGCWEGAATVGAGGILWIIVSFSMLQAHHKVLSPSHHCPCIRGLALARGGRLGGDWAEGCWCPAGCRWCGGQVEGVLSLLAPTRGAAITTYFRPDSCCILEWEDGGGRPLGRRGESSLPTLAATSPPKSEFCTRNTAEFCRIPWSSSFRNPRNLVVCLFRRRSEVRKKKFRLDSVPTNSVDTLEQPWEGAVWQKGFFNK